MITVRGIELTKANVAKMIDFSILHPDTVKANIVEGIELCKKYRFNSFCVNPNFLPMVVEGLKGEPCVPSVVLDFPFGSGSEAIKLAAAEEMTKAGAKALDMVIDVGALKDKNYKLVTQEIKNLVKAGGGIKTKIVEAWSFGCPVLGNLEAFEGLTDLGYPLALPLDGWGAWLAAPELPQVDRRRPASNAARFFAVLSYQHEADSFRGAQAVAAPA